MNNLQMTYWVRPEHSNSFLIMNESNIKDKDIFSSFFISNRNMELWRSIKNSNLESEVYEKEDLANSETVKLKIDDDMYEDYEILEFKKVLMTEKEITNAPEFPGF